MNNMNSHTKELSPEQRAELLSALKARFEKNMNRHEGLEWAEVQARLEANAEKLWSLNEMERTGGEPDVVGHDTKTGEMDMAGQIFAECPCFGAFYFNGDIMRMILSRMLFITTYPM